MEITIPIKIAVINWAIREAQKYSDHHATLGLKSIRLRLMTELEEASNAIQHRTSSQAANDKAGQVPGQEGPQAHAESGGQILGV